MFFKKGIKQTTNFKKSKKQTIHRELENSFKQKLTNKLEDLFSKTTLDTLSKQDLKQKNCSTDGKFQFINRFRKFTGDSFFKLLFLSSLPNLASMSLNELAIEFQKQTKKTISKEAINKKFNKEAVLFMKEILNRLIQDILSQNTPDVCYKNFGRVLVKDATSFQIHTNLKDSYKGSGGSGSEACIKIQFEFDLTTGNIIDLSLNPYTVTDSIDAKSCVSKINANDLLIRDLGYIDCSIMSSIEDKKAYYVNRLMSNVNVYIKKDESTFKLINFVSIIKMMRLYKINILEKEVYITQNKLKVRLIIELLPEDIIAKRLRIKYKTANKKGVKISQENINRSSLNLYITNTKTEQIAKEDIQKVYKIRWQIELMFKSFKQEIKINNFAKKMKVERFETLLLMKLIGVLINFKIFNILNFHQYKKNKTLISIQKIYSYFANYYHEFKESLRKNDLMTYIRNQIVFNDKLLREKKKGKESLENLLIRLNILSI